MFWKKSKKINDRKDLTVKEFEEWYRWWVQNPIDNLPIVKKRIADWIELPSKIKLRIETLAGTRQRNIRLKGNAK